MFKCVAVVAVAFIMTLSMSGNASAHDCSHCHPVKNVVKAVAGVPSGVVGAWQEAKPVRTVAERWSKARPVRSLLGRVRGRVRGCCK
tara:strand:+ start:697 stop:957 length:261 start_codon:yes stop_codon:yes gene_type:complete